jgi:hypothetical protein
MNDMIFNIWYFPIVTMILEIVVFVLGFAIITSSINGYRKDRERGEPELSPREFWLLGRGWTLLTGIFLVLLALFSASIRWLTNAIYSLSK